LVCILKSEVTTVLVFLQNSENDQREELLLASLCASDLEENYTPNCTMTSSKSPEDRQHENELFCIRPFLYSGNEQYSAINRERSISM
jgi:hypothetical protein